MPELLAELTERDAESESGDDVKRAEGQAEPGEWRHWLEDESVDLDDRSEEESHARRVGVPETVRERFGDSVGDAFSTLVGVALALLRGKQ